MATGTQIHVVAAALPAGSRDGLSPNGDAWRAVDEQEIGLAPTPLDQQPSAYVRASWGGKPYGGVPSVRCAAVVAAGQLFIRLRWATADPRPSITDNNVYADAAALLFPLDGVMAPLETMGSESRPVQAWHWRGGASDAFVLVAKGLGTTEREPRHTVSASAEWANGEWTAVFSRPLQAAGVPLLPGTTIPFGLAVWTGSAGERAGLKSHTPEWASLTLPATQE